VANAIAGCVNICAQSSAVDPSWEGDEEEVESIEQVRWKRRSKVGIPGGMSIEAFERLTRQPLNVAHEYLTAEDHLELERQRQNRLREFRRALGIAENDASKDTVPQ
jgi:hypothetical protein